MAIRIRDARLVKGRVTIFDGLTLALDEPRIGLIGDNGAGKTSLMRMVCGLDRPERGSIELDLAPGAARPVGMLFQNPDDQIVFPTAGEELALSLTAAGLARAQAQERVAAFLAARGLADWAPRAVGSLSHGQRQQLCWLALAIAGHRVLLLDEPYASLDLPGQARLKREIDAAAPQVILSTHAMAQVRDFGRVLWLERGRVRADGPGREVCAAYEADVAARLAAEGGARAA